MKLHKTLALLYKNVFEILSRQGIIGLYPIRVINDFIFSLNFETELVKQEIQEGDVVLDIGANIGFYTLIFANLLYRKGKVFAFEPDPKNFASLKKNVKMSGYQNVVLEQKAVANKTGKIKLYLSKENREDHRIYDSHDGRNSIEIEAVRLDDYFRNYNGRINFIKIDIQGAEWGAIQGMPSLLQKNKTLKIFTEFWPAGLTRFGIEPEKYLELLIKYGFKLYRADDQKKKIETTKIDELLETFTPQKENSTNLFCMREK
jgi:FkbM family methyltransferase